MGLLRGHVEVDSGGTHVFFAAGDRETGKKSTKYNLEAGRKKYHYEDASYSEHTYIHWQAPIDGSTVGGPPAHI